MPVARGSKSLLNWKQETVYGTAPAGNWNQTSFVSETLGGNINAVSSDEIRADRSRPSVRGGNVSAQGQIVTDFSGSRFETWLAHLLGGAAQTSLIAPATIANTTAYLRGDVVKNGANDYLCVTSGTTSGAAAADVIGTVLNARVDSGTAQFVFFGLSATSKFRHILDPLVPAFNILTSTNVLPTNGDIVTIGGKVYTLKTALAATEGDVLIGGSADAALLNLVRAINHTGTPGTDYIAAAVHPSVSADPTVSAIHTITVRAKVGGTAGNAITTTKVAATLTWTGATLAGGTDSDFLANGIAVEKAVRGGAADYYFNFVGGRIASLNIAISQEAITRATWEFVFAKDVKRTTVSAAGVPVVQVEDPFIGFECGVEINNVLNGVIREGTISISNDPDTDDFVLGSRFRRDIPPKRRMLNGTITALFENVTEVDLWLAETTFALKFSFYHNNQYLSIEFPECKFFGDPIPKVSSAGSVTVAFSFEAFKQVAPQDVEIVLKNLDTSITV